MSFRSLSSYSSQSVRSEESSPSFHHDDTNEVSARSPAAAPVDDVHLLPLEVPAQDSHEDGGKGASVRVSDTFDGVPWSERFFRIGSLLGLLSLLFNVLSIPAAFAILASSDGQVTSSWKYEPHVYLVIITAIGNKALTFAAAQGAVITWWNHAIRGSTLSKLHWSWKTANNLWDALVAGRNFNILALATFCTVIIVADGPLLQQATQTISKVSNQTAALNMSMTPEVPMDYTATIDIVNGRGETNPNNDFLQIMYQAFSNTPISAFVEGCPSKCSTTLHAPALVEAECSILDTDAVNYTAPLTRKETEIIQEQGAGQYLPSIRPIFELGFDNGFGEGRENFTITKLLADQQVTDTCVGSIQISSCTYLPAIAEYPVVIENGVIKFTADISRPKLVALANNTGNYLANVVHAEQQAAQHHGNYAPWQSMMGGFTVAASTMFGESTVGMIGYGKHANLNPGMSPIPAVSFPWVRNWNDLWNNKACAASFNDPTDDILEFLNELAFRIGVYSAQHDDHVKLASTIDKGLKINTTIAALTVDQQLVFKSNYWWFGAAAIVQALCVCVVLSTYWKWWRLGRDVSCGPLEIAKAFGSPLLADVNSNDTGDDMCKAIGDMRIRYGAVGGWSEADGQRRLAFAIPQDVYPPLHAYRFGN